VWPNIRTSQPGFTWDPQSNAYAKYSDPKSSPSRVDRVLLKSSRWLPRQIFLIGCAYIDLLCTRHLSNLDIVSTPALPTAQSISSGNATPPADQTGAPTTVTSNPDSPATISSKPGYSNSLLEQNAKTSSNSAMEAIQTMATTVASMVEPDASNSNEIYPSNHYGLLVHLSHFTPHC